MEIDATTYRDVWLYRREMHVCKERYVTTCKEMKLCRRIIRKIFQDEAKEKVTMANRVCFLVCPQKSLAPVKKFS